MILKTVEEINSKFEKDFAETESMLTRIQDLCNNDVITSRERSVLAVSIQNRQQTLSEQRRSNLITAILCYDSSQNVQSLRQMYTTQLEKMLELLLA